MSGVDREYVLAIKGGITLSVSVGGGTLRGIPVTSGPPVGRGMLNRQGAKCAQVGESEGSLDGEGVGAGTEVVDVGNRRSILGRPR